jgi:nifR3 family TIM-barrel protein
MQDPSTLPPGSLTQSCPPDTNPALAPAELRIGRVAIAAPFVQAALSGYSDWPMRVIARRHGAPYALCEVMLDEFLVQLRDRRRTSHFLHLSDEDHPVGGQLMGAEPDQFTLGARRLVEAGFDVIDINFGCPVKKVLGRCRGGFHLSQPDVALDIVQRTREIVPPAIPVTVKLRRGLDDTAESRDRFYSILDGAIDAGVAAVTVHPRTVQQRYVGPSQWGFLAEVQRHVGGRVPVLGSGDLFSPLSCLEMIARTGVAGVTIARGAIGNPWIFEQVRALAAGRPPIPPPSLHEQRAVILEHLGLAQQIYPERRIGLLMRKFGIRYAMLHPQFEAVRAAFVQAKSVEGWKAVLDEWYVRDEPGVDPSERMRSMADACGNS